MQRPRIAVIGASGYTGIELVRLLLAHDRVELVAASSDRWVGRRVEGSAELDAGALDYVSNEFAAFVDADVFMLATPAEASHELVPQLLARGARVVDLSGAYRLKNPSDYPRFYNFEHRHLELLQQAFYGLPEIGPRSYQPWLGARLVANPGCYATAIQLAIWPIASLVEDPPNHTLLAENRWSVVAMSGVTGAGRKASEEYSFVEIANDVRPYRVLRHQHTPEIEQHTHAKIFFVPQLIPIKRGIIATCTARLRRDVSAERVAEAINNVLGGQRFVKLAKSADDVSIKDVVGTNDCRIGWSIADEELVVVSALDNLLKGAAGQAVQNLNLMLGLPQTAGMQHLRSFHP